MKKSVQIIIACLICILSVSCGTKPVQLFNGENLDNWEKHLGTSLGSDFEELAAAATVDKVFSVALLNGEKVIRISGEINGALTTRDHYENYHMQLVFKWGEKVYSSRNSGLLYHSFGSYGAGFGTWMASIECQMKHGNLGDTYLMGQTTCESRAQRDGNNYFFNPGAGIVAFGEHANGRMINKQQNAEKNLGEWNTLDLYCYGQTAVHVVNGITVMVNENTGSFSNGAVQPLKGGKVQIQSEGGELFIKSVTVEPISKIPSEVMK